MTSIIGIPTTRVSDTFVRGRLLAQTQYDQRELFRLETQLSTGRRFETPSDDPVATLRIMNLQRLIERKTQVQSNLATNQSFLTSTDTSISQTSQLVAEARGAALGVIGTTSTDTQRKAVARQINQTVLQLIDTGNVKFRGRYLFAGSTTEQQPLEIANGVVAYTGNENRLVSYADTDLLFDTNLTGNEVFGTISEPVRGSADLNPALRAETRLRDLRGGRGIAQGSIVISDGVESSIVDLTGAETVGDVAMMIAAHPPAGRSLDVQVTATGLVIQLDAAPGNLTIREMGAGTTASDLGILEENGVGNAPLVGDDVNPRLLPTTRLDRILATPAQAVVRFTGADNDILLEADATGAAMNGVTIRLVDDPAVTYGNEVVTYDPVGKAIEVRIDENRTEARHVVAALTAAHGAGTLPFSARLDPIDLPGTGHGLVPVTPLGEFAATTAGGGGTPLDLAAGIQIVNGGQTHTISFASAETVEDLLNQLNGSPAGVLAEINAAGTGIDVRSRLSGTDFAIAENGGTTATQLGLRTFREDVELANVNFGRGLVSVEIDATPGFVVTRSDGTQLTIDVTSAVTVGDIIAQINNDPANLAHATPLTARLATVGNGIELADPLGGTLTISQLNHSASANELGLIPVGEETASVTTAAGATAVLTGSDVACTETEGLFTALVRLEQGLENNDMATVERAMAMLDRGTLHLNFARADLGGRQQALEVLGSRLDNEEVQLKEVLSLDHDVDIVEVISNLTARQTAYEAGLRATGMIFQMTLLNYL